MATFKQDMPPPGGYAPITFRRIPLKAGWNVQLKLGICVGIMGVALIPMLTAEVDRMMLKQLKRNRDAEERIMKDVEGWELGKWKGQPVFFSLGPNDFYKPAQIEYYAHADTYDRLYPENIMKVT